MQRILLVLTLFITTFWSIPFTNSSPISNNNNPSQSFLAGDDVLVGWTGIRRQQDAEAFQKQPYASGGGELGAVLYIADGTDLARFFAAATGYVCQVYTSGKPWSIIRKDWVSQNELVTYKNRMQDLHPGSVLFASHTSPGIPDTKPWQMGIRPGSIKVLGVSAKCYPVANPIVGAGKKLNYPSRIDWNIQGTPERGP